MQYLASFLLIWARLWLAGKSETFNPRDNSDGIERSGLIVRTDCLTGLQYMQTTWGGITPRLNQDGSQVIDFSPCATKEKPE